MQRSFNKAIITNLMTEDFLLPDTQVLDELDIFESALPGEVVSHIEEPDDREESPLDERGNWTKH